MEHIVVGTTQRLSSLRQSCLIRDRFRCAISRSYDPQDAYRRYEKDGDLAQDDDGELIFKSKIEHLEMCHIIPHALASMDGPLKLLVSFS